MPIVTFTTDFGERDAYVASMKGEVLSECPTCQLVDITHEIPPQDILKGYMVLEDCFDRFPRGTIHVGVVDPGVGTRRLPLVVEAEGHFFVGPDNGLFSFARARDGFRIWQIQLDEGTPKKSATFEGRDVFSPVAGKLARGVSVGELAEPLPKMVFLSLPNPQYGLEESVGEVVAMDHFGNLITNLLVDRLGTPPRWVVLDGKAIGPIQRTYNDVPRMNLLALENSMGRLEIAVSQGSAREVLKARKGMKVVVRKVEKS